MELGTADRTTEFFKEDDNVKKLIRRATVLPLNPIDSIEDVLF